MPWTEIKLSDLQARDASAIAELKKFLSSQALMNQYYATKLTRENVKDMLQRKASLDIRLYNYEDENTFATLALKKNSKGELRLLTTSCGKGDVSTAADIVQAAIKIGMQRVGVVSCYALWSSSNYEAGNAYYQEFVSRCNENFQSSSNTEYSPGKYRLEMNM